MATALACWSPSTGRRDATGRPARRDPEGLDYETLGYDIGAVLARLSHILFLRLGMFADPDLALTTEGVPSDLGSGPSTSARPGGWRPGRSATGTRCASSSTTLRCLPRRLRRRGQVRVVPATSTPRTSGSRPTTPSMTPRSRPCWTGSSPTRFALHRHRQLHPVRARRAADRALDRGLSSTRRRDTSTTPSSAAGRPTCGHCWSCPAGRGRTPYASSLPSCCWHKPARRPSAWLLGSPPALTPLPPGRYPECCAVGLHVLRQSRRMLVLFISQVFQEARALRGIAIQGPEAYRHEPIHPSEFPLHDVQHQQYPPPRRRRRSRSTTSVRRTTSSPRSTRPSLQRR